MTTAASPLPLNGICVHVSALLKRTLGSYRPARSAICVGWPLTEDALGGMDVQVGLGQQLLKLGVLALEFAHARKRKDEGALLKTIGCAGGDVHV